VPVSRRASGLNLTDVPHFPIQVDDAPGISRASIPAFKKGKGKASASSAADGLSGLDENLPWCVLALFSI
jgi:hypothetical protein